MFILYSNFIEFQGFSDPKNNFFSYIWHNISILKAGRNWQAIQCKALETQPKGRCPASPHEFTCVGPRGKRRPCAGNRLSTVDATARGPRSPSRDTATGTSPTWPPASSNVASPRPEDFSSCNPRASRGPLRVTPTGLSEARAAGQHASHGQRHPLIHLFIESFIHSSIHPSNK